MLKKLLSYLPSLLGTASGGFMPIIILTSLLIASNSIWYAVLCNKNSKIKEITKDADEVKKNFIKNDKKFIQALSKKDDNLKIISKAFAVIQNDYVKKLQSVNDDLILKNAKINNCEEGVKNLGLAFNQTLFLKEKKDIEIKEELNNK